MALSPTESLRVWLDSDKPVQDSVQLCTTASGGFSGLVAGSIEHLAALPTKNDLRRSQRCQLPLADVSPVEHQSSHARPSQRATSTSTASLLDLPDELLMEICKRLPAKALCMLGATCTTLNRILSSDRLVSQFSLRIVPQLRNLHFSGSYV